MNVKELRKNVEKMVFDFAKENEIKDMTVVVDVSTFVEDRNKNSLVRNSIQSVNSKIEIR